MNETMKKQIEAFAKTLTEKGYTGRFYSSESLDSPGYVNRRGNLLQILNEHIGLFSFMPSSPKPRFPFAITMWSSDRVKGLFKCGFELKYDQQQGIGVTRMDIVNKKPNGAEETRKQILPESIASIPHRDEAVFLVTGIRKEPKKKSRSINR